MYPVVFVTLMAALYSATSFILTVLVALNKKKKSDIKKMKYVKIIMLYLFCLGRAYYRNRKRTHFD